MGMFTAVIVVEMERHPTEIPPLPSLGPPPFCDLICTVPTVPQGLPFSLPHPSEWKCDLLLQGQGANTMGLSSSLSFLRQKTLEWDQFNK